MSIKAKLIGLALLMTLVLGILAGSMLWASHRVHQQVRFFLPAISCLRGIADARINVTRQMKEATDVLVSARRTDREDFRRFGERTRAAMELWLSAARRQKALGFTGEDDDLRLAASVLDSYEDWEDQVAGLFPRAADGRRAEALEAYATRSDLLFEGKVLSGIDQALEDGLNEVQDTFHELLMSLGLLPWLAEDGLQRVRATQASIEYLLAVNRFSAGVNKQVKSLLDYLLFGSEQNLLFFTDYGKETKSAIEACARAANRRASVEPTKKAALLDEVVTIEHGYGQITALADKAIRLKRAGQGRQALELVADGLDPLLDTGLIPKITLALDEGGQEILALSRTASRRGAAIVAVVSLLILAGTLHLIHGMLGSLEKLRTGIGVIGEGNLEYRIDLDTRDEFGVLAASFNDMVARLQQSRTALDRLNADLEKRVEERTDQLRTANRELETFSYSVSHDLRSPLARIQALCQILQDPDDPDLSGEAAESIERIAQATEDMDQLIAALLSLSQVASGEMNRRPVDLSAMARTLVEELRQREPERSTTIRIAPDVVVDGDPSLLLVAMANLLGNAWKFTARTSRPKIEFGALPADGSRTFFVRDNGAGFDMEQAEKIFSPFRRLHEEEEFKGTGIGLATVQRIIHRHGGRIWAEGEIGRGATFLFTLGPPPGTNRS